MAQSTPNKRNTMLKSKPATGSSALQNLRPHPALYQINTWAWIDSLSLALGRTITLADIPDAEWDAIQALGFDIVYLMGIWQRSLAGRHIFRTDAQAFKVFDHALPNWRVDNVIGSPFSISEYQPDAHVGNWNELDVVRAKLHARGMRLMLDFVPNHLGPDHPWLYTHPEYFLQGSEEDYHHDPQAFFLIEPDGRAPYFVARGRDPYFAPWADTVQLNYFHPETRLAMLSILQTIAQHCDGLRCDMAMLVLNEVFSKTWQPLLQHTPLPQQQFWTQAIAALPDQFIWMAEVYWDMEAQLLELGFTYAYDKRMYDRLCHSSVPEIRAHLSADIAYQQHMARFLENHDEPRSAHVFGPHTLTAFATFIATVPGLRFFHQGQLVGRTLHLPMPLNKAADERIDNVLLGMYQHLLGLVNQAVFHQGEWCLLDVKPDTDDTHHQLIAYRWVWGESYRLVVINLSEHSAQGRVYIAHELAECPAYDLHDVMNETHYLRDREDLLQHGLYVRLDAYSVHVFEPKSILVTH